jgi:hypothetical protein
MFDREVVKEREFQSKQFRFITFKCICSSYLYSNGQRWKEIPQSTTSFSLILEPDTFNKLTREYSYWIVTDFDKFAKQYLENLVLKNPHFENIFQLLFFVFLWLLNFILFEIALKRNFLGSNCLFSILFCAEIFPRGGQLHFLLLSTEIFQVLCLV